MHEYEISILDLLKKSKSADLNYLQSNLDISKDSISWALENLSKNGLIKIERINKKVPKLTEEGKRYLKQFPEEEIVRSLYKSGGSDTLYAMQNFGKPAGIGFIWAKNNGWVAVEKDGTAKLTEKGKKIAQNEVQYDRRKFLEELSSADKDAADGLIEKSSEIVGSLKKRDLLEISDKSTIKKIEISEKGLATNVSAEDGIGSLTREMLLGKKWEKEKFRHYDINASSEETYPARLHPLHEFLDVIRQIWLNMGFTEVSGPIIEPAFWVFDALFSPQDHPTRDMQDTFFLKNPSKLSVEDIALMKRVKKMHQAGWKEKWREEVAQQAILRTHTTSVSARYINKFANLADDKYPIKLFTVGRNFRNESIDYKHLAEFYMFEGIIIGNNLTLSNLIYTLKQFYAQLGIEDLVFKPAYFPFVEPGLEICYFDKKRNDTIELGGAGIIRKEITKAMGTNKTVLAWGPGLDRLMFKAFDIDNLTELYKNDIGWLRKRKELRL